jgi:5'-3' exonuclease
MLTPCIFGPFRRVRRDQVTVAQRAPTSGLDGIIHLIRAPLHHLSLCDHYRYLDEKRQRDVAKIDDAMKVHLIDGTYELFRQHFGAARRPGSSGRAPSDHPFAASIGVVTSTLAVISDAISESGSVWLGVATDHEIRSFRNDLWAGYKTGEDTPLELLTQIPMMKETLEALGVTVWPMVEFEADDAMASAAEVAALDPGVTKVVMITPDKDLAQCVREERVVLYDRRKGEYTGHDGVLQKFGVLPSSIPDYLGLVGDSSDGFPGLPGWGAKSAAAVLARYHHLEAIPEAVEDWDVPGLRGAARLAETLRDNRPLAELFRQIATVVRTVDVGQVTQWRWSGPTTDLREIMDHLGAPELADRAERLAARLTAD